MSTNSNILIVGAGPSGLAAAVELVRQGCRVRVVEKLGARLPQSKALGINSRTLKLLEASDVTPRLLEAGRKAVGAWIHWHGKSSSHIPFALARSEYPFMVVLPQSDTESILEARLEELGASVERDVSVESVQLDNHRVCARLLNARTHSQELIEVDYLIGADGAHSTVRKSLEIPFLGTTLPQTWSLADVRWGGDLPEDHANIFVGENSFLFALCMRPGVFRVASNSEHVLDELEQIGHVTDVLWQTPFTVHHRVAERLQVGNVALIGDAAHIHSPLGARGMNLGIEDAAIVARRLVDQQWNRYGKERPRAIHRVVRRIRLQTSLASGRGFSSVLQKLAPIPLKSSWLQRLFAETVLAVRAKA